MKLVILVLQCYYSVNVLNRVMSFKTMGNMIGQVSVACPTKRSQPPLQSSSITVFLNCDQAVLLLLLGSFSINDGYGSANVTCKMNLPFFKLCRVSSNSLTMSNEGEFPLSWFLRGPYSSLKRERKIRHRLFTSSIKREIRYFHVVVVQWLQRNVQKNVMSVQSCCFG